MNAMLGYAKAWKGRKYYVKQQEYREEMEHCLPVPPPGVPWEQWAIDSVHFRLWGWRDPLEALAGLKWPIDFLVDLGWLAEDDRNSLVGICIPTQEINRKNRGVTITLRKV